MKKKSRKKCSFIHNEIILCKWLYILNGNCAKDFDGNCCFYDFIGFRPEQEPATTFERRKKKRNIFYVTSISNHNTHTHTQ